MNYYVYVIGLDRESVTIYKTEHEAELVRVGFENAGYEAYVCEFGYPFAPSH